MGCEKKPSDTIEICDVLLEMHTNPFLPCGPGGENAYRLALLMNNEELVAIFDQNPMNAMLGSFEKNNLFLSGKATQSQKKERQAAEENKEEPVEGLPPLKIVENTFESFTSFLEKLPDRMGVNGEEKASLGKASTDETHMGPLPPLLSAAIEGDAERCASILQKGTDVNVADSRNRTALIIAVQLAQEQIVRLLLDYKADIDHVEDDGGTALSIVSKEMENNALSPEKRKIYIRIKKAIVEEQTNRCAKVGQGRERDYEVASEIMGHNLKPEPGSGAGAGAGSA